MDLFGFCTVLKNHFKKGFSFFSLVFGVSVLVGFGQVFAFRLVRKLKEKVPGRVPQRLGYVALQGTLEKGEKNA